MQSQKFSQCCQHVCITFTSKTADWPCRVWVYPVDGPDDALAAAEDADALRLQVLGHLLHGGRRWRVHINREEGDQGTAVTSQQGHHGQHEEAVHYSAVERGKIVS